MVTGYAMTDNFTNNLGIFYTLWLSLEATIEYEIGRLLNLPHRKTHANQGFVTRLRKGFRQPVGSAYPSDCVLVRRFEQSRQLGDILSDQHAPP